MNNKHTKAAILSIDSVITDATLLENSLMDVGFKFEFHHATTLREGLRQLTQQDFDLVLLDIQLDDVSGFKVISLYMEQASHVPVVVVTSLNNEIIINQSVKAGIQDFLLKGQFDSKTLCRVARFSMHRFLVQSRLEQTAREFESHKKRFLEAQKMAQFGTWEMDVVTNEMTWSDEVFRIFSLQKGSLAPTLSEYINYVPSEEKDTVESFFEDAGRDGDLHNFEHRIVLDATIVRHVIVQAMVKMEESGHRVMLVGSIQDITERKTSERLLMEKAISSQTARIQEEVLADLGFQIRTPLSSIVNLMFLLDNSETSNQQDLLITDLKTSVNDLSISVNNLLNFSLMVTENVKEEAEDIVLLEFLKGAENVVRIKADAAKMSVKFVPDKKLPEKITADPRKITQIIFNLIEYVLRQGSEGELITVTATCAPMLNDSLGLNICIRTSSKQYNANELNEMTNAESIIKKAFGENKNESVAAKRLMGMAISTKLINSLEGNLHFQNLGGSGSEILVSIPVRPTKQVLYNTGAAPLAPMKILMVEDHFLNQLATKKVLTSWSNFVSVDIAENGQIGYEAVRDNDYDLVLMDIQMPVMNGIDSAKKIREFSQVPIIALTANSTKQEQEKCLEIGMNDYLSKPFKPLELYERILAVMVLVED
ncbi:MAG: response regulator [Saprospiraceae bacterium]|nr:response regulator [Saprospiraceae bacterium]MCF8248314.1 response regulator [Saprospiraceae bacterium]MCF8280247.1 response regulator [Bacteroidales bacterium]MCF8309842.1 response regulator [Saprospiraceae bacterium]MCF8438827.1 response regulator [Saprospiraceae bacterium]